jgi:hypothetical protein
LYYDFFPPNDINMDTLISSNSQTTESVTIDGIAYTVYYSHQVSYLNLPINVYVGLYEYGSKLKLILLQPELIISQPGGLSGKVREHIITVDLEMNINNNCWVSNNIILWSYPDIPIVDESINVSNYTPHPMNNFNIKYC